MAEFSNFFDPNNPEFNIYNDASQEIIDQFGIPAKYIPKNYLPDADVDIFGEDESAFFENAIDVKLYLENYSDFEGSGDLFSKFGLVVDDRATFIAQQEVFLNTIRTALNNPEWKPMPGDLIYFEFAGIFMEIYHAEDERDAFYHFGKQMLYKFSCKKWHYSGETVETGINEIDDIMNAETIGDNQKIEDKKVNIVDFSEDNPFANIDD